MSPPPDVRTDLDRAVWEMWGTIMFTRRGAAIPTCAECGRPINSLGGCFGDDGHKTGHEAVTA